VQNGASVFLAETRFSEADENTMALIDKRLVCAALAVLAGAAPVCAEPLPRYTVEDCVRIGLENSAVMARARQDAAIARAEQQQAGAEVLPSLTLDAGYTRQDELTDVDFGDETVEFGFLDTYRASAEVSQSLYSGGRSWAAIRAASARRDLARSGMDEARTGLVRDIRTSFADLLLAQAAVDVRRESVDVLTAFLEQTREKRAQGTASEFDALSAEVRVRNERPALIGASNRVAVGRARFRRLLNIDERFALEGELERAPAAGKLADFESAALRHRSVLREYEALVELRRRDLQAARSGTRPALRAFFGYRGANTYGFSEADAEWEWHWDAGATLSWPLWDGGLTAGRVAQKRAELAKSQTDLEDRTRAVLLEVQQAYLDLQSAEEAIAAAEGGVELAEQALDIARTRYASGLATALEFMDANLARSRARLTMLEALRGQVNAVTRLACACGLPDRSPAEIVEGNANKEAP